MIKNTLYSCLILLFLDSCGQIQEQGSALPKQANSKSYFKETALIQINVYYTPDAIPFTDNNKNGKSYWKILDDNLIALFKYRSTPPNIIVPYHLDEMNELPVQSIASWNPDSLIALHNKYKVQNTSESSENFHIYFLKGNSSNGTGVIGLNISGTTIIAIFKDVISASGGPIVQRYVEQSTLVHEMGHALGLVNNGIPLSSSHQDLEHGAHTKNSDCVMYWLNEGASDLALFISKFITSGSNIMWGPEVLEDVKNYSR